MSELPTTQQQKPQIAMGVMNGGRSLMPTTIEEAYRIADAFSKSEFVPKAYRGKPNDAFAAIVLGMEVGLPPMRSLQSIATVNGTPSIWGDAQLALVRNSGLLTYFREWYEGDEGKDNFIACCKAVRVGEEQDDAETVTFSVADAKKAGLWDKPGTWKTHPKRMLRYKSRAFALRDKFADVLLGLTHSIEEMEGESYVDVTPKARPNTGFTKAIKDMPNEIRNDNLSAMLAQAQQPIPTVAKMETVEQTPQSVGNPKQLQSETVAAQEPLIIPSQSHITPQEEPPLPLNEPYIFPGDVNVN